MPNPNNEQEVQEQIKNKIQKPKRHKVILLNDDFTPMEFVIVQLMQIFNKSESDAYRITMDIHEKEKGIAGVYSKDIAITKMKELNNIAELNKFPLTSITEEE